jgi:hypothetical protein
MWRGAPGGRDFCAPQEMGVRQAVRAHQNRNAACMVGGVSPAPGALSGHECYPAQRPRSSEQWKAKQVGQCNTVPHYPWLVFSYALRI